MEEQKSNKPVIAMVVNYHGNKSVEDLDTRLRGTGWIVCDSGQEREKLLKVLTAAAEHLDMDTSESYQDLVDAVDDCTDITIVEP